MRWCIFNIWTLVTCMKDSLQNGNKQIEDTLAQAHQKQSIDIISRTKSNRKMKKNQSKNVVIRRNYLSLRHIFSSIVWKLISIGLFVFKQKQIHHRIFRFFVGVNKRLFFLLSIDSVLINMPVQAMSCTEITIMMTDCSCDLVNWSVSNNRNT